MFLLLFCRKQASLWIQGDIFRTREKDKAERGLFLSACFPTSFLGSNYVHFLMQNNVGILIYIGLHVQNWVPFSYFKAMMYSEPSLFMLALDEEGSLWKEKEMGRDKVKYTS